MKKKLTILLFGLLLAVGWTGSAFAQSQEEPLKAEDAKTWTYDWVDAQGTTHTGADPTEEVTDAHQMYYLLRHVYMDKRFPGPYQSAYKADGTTRERDVYYGGIDSGWEIPGTLIDGSSTPTTTTSTVTFTGSSSTSVVRTKTIDGVTLNTSSGDLGYSDAMRLNGTITLTTTEGTITNIVFNGYNTSYPVSRLSAQNGNYSYSGNVGTWTGNAASVSLSASSYVYCSSIVVTISKTTGGDTGIGDILISGNDRNAVMTAITVKSGNTTLFSWTWAQHNMNYPAGMSLNSWGYYQNQSYGLYFSEDLKPITLQGWLFEGYSSVTVTVHAFAKSNTTGTLAVNGDTKNVTSTSTSGSDFTWTVNAKQLIAPPTYQADTYKPNKEGYTALVVRLKDNGYHAADAQGFGHHQSFYESKDSIISYLERNVESILLLTDGLVIGEGDQIGTVFNCPSVEYNKFFFLSKGQARQKTNMVITEQKHIQHLLGEQVPFAQLFEQFSPTGGKDGDQITDFYSEMMQGKVYRIVHDCLSVIQNSHQFSMSGNTGTTPYKMTGMNFFIPDHRLQYWELTDTVKGYQWNSSTEKFEKGVVLGTYTVDGRDMNPYQPASANKVSNPSTFYETPSQVAVWYAQYDTAQHAPLVGIYLIKLQAEASQCEDYSESNRYYNVDLDWTSSLNEMSQNGVSQTYIIYQVITDPATGEYINVPIDTVEDCSDFRPHLRLDTLYEQRAHSYTLTYVIQGSPTDSDHPGFIAWSNTATVIIPGYDDFMVLDLHHYESDFVVNQERNYYRNYMQPVNDFANGITAESIRNGFDSFILYRTSTDGKVPVAKLKLAVNSNNQVLYKITYFDENEDYNDPNYDNTVLPSIINQLLNKQ